MSEIINDTASPASYSRLAGVWQERLKQQLNDNGRTSRRESGWQLCFNRP
ncbi:hypothetical protein [Klebsiella pneumoniae IS39]|nr:hypothetical protein [Klebsiella pneumoniae IS39]